MIMTTMMIMMTFVCLFSLFTANMLEDIPHLILQIVIISNNSVRKTFSYSFAKFLSAQSAYVSRENGECRFKFKGEYNKKKHVSIQSESASLSV